MEGTLEWLNGAEAVGNALKAWWAWLMLWGSEHPLLWGLLRTIGLALVVMATIFLIAGVYGGDIQNGRYGPVGIRKHSNAQLSRRYIRIPPRLVEGNIDGLHADRVEIWFSYSDSKGKQQDVRVARLKGMEIQVVRSGLNRVTDLAYGHDVTAEIAALNTEDVFLPALEGPVTGEAGETQSVQPTLPHVGEHISARKLDEAWKEDDDAAIISLKADVVAEIVESRTRHIVDNAKQLQAARSGNWLEKMRVRSLSAKRPNVFGSYYVRFRFSKNPLVILTRHPDRDLKMTAWLTVLTSLFAMLTEFIPLRTNPPESGRPAQTQPSPDAPRLNLNTP